MPFKPRHRPIDQRTLAQESHLCPPDLRCRDLVCGFVVGSESGEVMRGIEIGRTVGDPASHTIVKGSMVCAITLCSVMMRS